MTPVCPRILNMITDFVLLRFCARASEDLSAIEVILLLLLLLFVLLVLLLLLYCNTETKPNEIQKKVSCNMEADQEIAQEAIDAYIDKLNSAMRELAIQAGCYSKHYYNTKKVLVPWT